MATPILIGAPRPSPFFTPLFVAIDRGFFAEQGLDARMSYKKGRDALASGEIDFASGGSIYQQYLSGDVTMICGHATRETSHVLMLRPEIESVAGLEHVLLPGGSGPRGDMFMEELRKILAIYGMDLEESRIETGRIEGSHPEQWKMLQEGIGDAATLGAPYCIFAARSGYRNAGSAAEYGQSATGSGIYVAPESIRKDPEVVRGFVRAYAKTMRYCATHPTETLETMVRYANDWGVDDEVIAKAVYDEVAPYWRIELDVAALREMLESGAQELGQPTRPVEAFLETRFLDEALAGLDAL